MEIKKKLTFDEARFAAVKIVRDAAFFGNKIIALVYKNAVGDYTVRELYKGNTICYTELKALVWCANNGDIHTEVSRETISNMIETRSTGVKFVYFS